MVQTARHILGQAYAMSFCMRVPVRDDDGARSYSGEEPTLPQ